MTQEKQWILIPATDRDIDLIAKKCRAMVMRRAALSAGVAALPVPGVDIATDIGLFTMLIDDINTEFGLTPAQIGRLQPKLKLIAYQALASAGGLLAGKLITREVITHVLKRSGAKTLAHQAVRFVPFAGQAASAAIGFAAFRAIGNRHVAACVAVAREVVLGRAAAV